MFVTLPKVHYIPLSPSLQPLTPVLAHSTALLLSPYSPMQARGDYRVIMIYFGLVLCDLSKVEVKGPPEMGGIKPIYVTQDE